MLHLFYLLIICLIYQSNQSYLSEETLSNIFYLNNITTCLEEIALSNFISNEDLLTVLTDDYNYIHYDLQNILLKRLERHWYLRISNGTEQTFSSYTIRKMSNRKKHIYKNYFQPLIKPRYYLILIKNFESFLTLTNKLTSLLSYNSRGMYVIYFNNISKSRKEIAEAILERLWRLYIWKCIVIMPVDNFHLEIYSASMHDQSQKCIEVPNIYLKGTCINGKMEYDSHLFTSIIQNDLHGL